MANRFEVQVVALDRYTKVFRDLNDKASKAARPLVNVQRQVGALGREMHLDKVAKGMGKVSDAAVTVSRTLGLSLGPLESVFGLGAAGGIVGGIAAAGAAAIGLGVKFATAGFDVARASVAFGVSARDLQRLRGAAKLASVDMGVMDQTVASLGDTLQNARWNRDITALMALNRIHVGLPVKGGQVDTLTALNGIAEVMRQMPDAHARNTLADTLHIPREAIPLLMKGADAMKQLGDEAERQGNVVGPKALQWSIDFTDSLNRLQGAINGVANSWGARLVPTLTAGMDYLAKMTEQSEKDRFSTALKGMNDMRLGGWRALQWLGSAALHGNVPTTEAERQVSGKIGGPLQQGPFRAQSPGAAASASAAASSASAVAPARSASERAMAAQMQFTPAELERQQENEQSDENRRQLIAEIARTRDPGNRAILQQELAKLQGQSQQVIEVNVHNLPAGATVSAHVKGSGSDGYTPTRINYSLARDEMP